MKLPADFIIKRFLRTYTSPFSLKDFSMMLSRIGFRFTTRDCLLLLEESPDVFSLENEMYITRAGAFTGQYFSFKPSRAETALRVFIPGHRFLPFVDSDMLSCSLSFLYNGKPLPRVVVDYDSNAALDLFSLYGDEFSSQYIAADPANSGIDLGKTAFVLPPKVKMTAVSIVPVIEHEGFGPGDRFLCRIIDWNKGIIELSAVHHEAKPMQMDMSDVERESWYSLLEERLLRSFDVFGPCASIEQQLSFVFVEGRKNLCVKNCGSVEELFLRSKKIGFELFGVETRLWRKNEDVPAFGMWNNALFLGKDERALPEYEPEDESEPQYIIDAYLRDLIYQESENYEELMKKIYPFYYTLSDAQRSVLLLHLKNRRDILDRSYNRFADFELGAIRHKALELYTVVNELVCVINRVESSLCNFPQRPLVILTQIFGHIRHIIELIETEPSAVQNEMEEILLSLEGMEFNFEGISEPLRLSVDREVRNGFSVKP